MTLIVILFALAIEQFIGLTKDFRQLTWFESYFHWLENKTGHLKLWNGPVGVIMVLAGPLLIVWLITCLLANTFFLLPLIFALAVLTYSFGHHFLNNELDNYVDALEANDDQNIGKIESELIDDAESGDQEQLIIEGVLINTSDRLFGVLFWFLVLGPFGAIMYRLAAQLKMIQADIHGNFSDSTRDLYNILNWPVARLFALGNALSGNLVGAVDAWREVESESLLVNDEVIKTSGLGALQYRPGLSSIDDSIENERLYWMQSLQGLLNRTLFIWLTIVGVISIAGWLG